MRVVRLALWFLVGVLLVGVGELSFAQTYEYTSKVTATTGGVSKSNQPVLSNHWGCTTAGSNYGPDSTQSASTAHCVSVLNGIGVSGSLTGGAWQNGYGFVYSYGGWGIYQTAQCPSPQTGPDSTDHQTCYELACPAGTVFNSYDNLCYSQSCPTVSGSDPNQNAWEPDPGNSSQCRRQVVSCPTAGTVAGAVAGTSVTVGMVNGSWRMCAPSGCAYSISGVASVQGGATYAVGPYVSLGSACGGTQPPLGEGSSGATTSSGAENACPPGQVPGTINGTTVCVNQGTGSTSKVDKSQQVVNNPDGTSTVIETTKTTTTTCDASGNCTTTVTTSTTSTPYSGANGTGTAGTPTTTTSNGQPQDNPMDTFCKDNPTSPMCTNGSWGGSCGGGFACEGDAVECALAKEVYIRNCQTLEPVAGVATQADMISAAGSILQSTASGTATTSSTLPSLDQSTVFSSACLSPMTFDAMGQHFSIARDGALCDWMRYFGYVLVALTTILCAWIIMRGFEY